MSMSVSLMLNFGLLVFLVAVALALARWQILLGSGLQFPTFRN